MTDITAPSRSNLRRFVLPVLLVAALGAGGAVWKTRTAGDAAAVPAVQAPLPPSERPVELAAVEVTRVVPRRLTETVRLSGSVEPLNQSLVKSEVAARLVEVPVREGQAVRKGEVLARFDTAELTAKLNEKLSNLEGAKAQLVLAEKTRAKNLALRQKDIVAETNLDQAQSTFRFQQATVAALEAQVELARKALRDAVVVSPIDGTVAERVINPGENLAVNTKMFSVVDLSRVEVEATVPADDVARLKPGQFVRLRVEGFGERDFEGRIARINPVARAGTRAIPVYVSLDNADGSLRGGMFAAGDAVVAEAGHAFALPPAALRHDDQGDFVLVVAGDRVERRKVEKRGLWSRGDLVQVEGLQEGDVVVTAPLPGLAAGRAVKVVGS
ncbi:efflux RND transporter periplasmic adaptor subunit [Azospirillum soli]|uniref:efflux RND transporter periplasmic adaptor subunit n=1 Tax=Azospirillum soli TaxID=1304799 RepID=UPI001AE35804|nr:efflux RND transporter periplasmic adaptor subunit [Azospirillum soli]MBP2315871.1 RND family efflux transporter MFP subunit [Azospirillum soli]